jgi:hypothetical protein
MKFQIEVTTVVNIPYRPAQYPAGMTPQEALSLEVEELSKDPRELMALDAEVVGIRSVVLDDHPKRSPFADLAERALSSVR